MYGIAEKVRVIRLRGKGETTTGRTDLKIDHELGCRHNQSGFRCRYIMTRHSLPQIDQVTMVLWPVEPWQT